jgi:hypothetical protein
MERIFPRLPLGILISPLAGGQDMIRTRLFEKTLNCLFQFIYNSIQ